MPPETISSRSDHELAHGRYLATHQAENIWGWSSPAGRLRADRRAELIIRGAGLKPGMNVVEVGCGTGLITERLARSGATIVAIDISPDLHAQARTRGLDPNQVRFVEGRFEDSGLAQSFDAVIGSSVLHHLEVEPSLLKIRSLLKPGGVMCFAEPNMLNPQNVVQKNVAFVKRWMGDSPDETAFVRWSLKAALERSGFTDIDINPFDWLHPVTPRVMIPAVRAVERLLERLPGAREFSGSLLCRAVARSNP